MIHLFQLAHLRVFQSYFVLPLMIERLPTLRQIITTKPEIFLWLTPKIWKGIHFIADMFSVYTLLFLVGRLFSLPIDIALMK